MAGMFFVRAGKRYEVVHLDNVIYAEVKNQYVSIVTSDGTITTLATLRQLEKYLPKDQFCRVHRAYIVAVKHIRSFDTEKVYLKSKEIPLAYNCRVQLIKSVDVLTRETPAKSKTRKTIRQIQQGK